MNVTNHTESISRRTILTALAIGAGAISEAIAEHRNRESTASEAYGTGEWGTGVYGTTESKR